MTKKILKTENLLLFVAFVFPIAISFTISLINCNLPQLNFYTYVGKCLSIVKQNMGYYGTVFGLFLAMKKYSEDKKQSEKEKEEREKEKEEKLLEKQQELIRIQKESNLLREQEIENRKDNYRPTFIITNNKIKLLMRREDLYLENIIYYPFKSRENDNKLKYIGTKKSGEYIIEGTKKNPIPDSFYVTGETILGEKILFGFLFGELKIYKYLKYGGNPIHPFGIRNINFDLDKMSKHWGRYNFIENTDKEDILFINIEKLFFYNSLGIRLNNSITNLKSMKNFLISTNYVELYRNLFNELKMWSPIMIDDSMDCIAKIINLVYNQIFSEGTSVIKLLKMFNNKIEDNKIFIESRIKVIKDKVFQDEKELFIPLEKCEHFFEESIKLKKGTELSISYILGCIKEIKEYASKLPNYSEEKRMILDFCLTTLTIVFENIEEREEVEVEKNILNSYLLQHKSQILNEIEFKKSGVKI